MTSIKWDWSDTTSRKQKLVVVLMAVLLTVTATASTCNAQTFSEWFKQSSTQKKYLLQQIAALQVYIGFARDGYRIVDGGLQTVKNITSGEFSLHEAFVSGLKKVSPVIKNDVRIAEIISLQLSIIKSFTSVKKSELLSASHVAYIASVGERVISDCYQDLEELLLVITSGKLEMKDDERLVRLSGIYERIQEKSDFTRDFCGNVSLLILQKKSEHNTINDLRRFYEVE
ncbi:MAG: hypothetical protein V4594_14895 [Bacteroidota bacterium]